MSITTNGLISKVLSLPLVRAIELGDNEKRDTVQEFIEPVIDEVLTSHLWDFMLDEATFLNGTVKDQANYTLEGNKSDCRDIVTVKYGDAENVLEERDPIDMEEWLTGRTHNTVNFWIMDGRVDKFPRIKIIATPGTANVQIKYRYAKNNVTLNDVPNEFEFVIVSGIASWLIPGYVRLYDRHIKKMISHHAVAGGHDRPALVDRYLVQMNNRRSRKYGYGG